MAHFEVGGKVICVKSGKNNVGVGVEKGKVYPLNAILKGCCGNDLYFDVGIELFNGNGCCDKCGKKYPKGNLYVSSHYFAPYDDSLSEITVEELLYQLTE